MGLAKKHLSEERRKEIAASLFQVTSEDTSRGELIGLCPIHGEKNASFAYNYRRDVYNCLSCQASGDLVRLFCEVQGLGQSDGVRAFCERFEVERSGAGPGADQALDEADRERFIDRSVFEKIPDLSPAWVARLKNERGWSREVIERFGLRLHTVYRTGEERVAIPVWDDEGRLGNIRLYRPGSTDTAKVMSWSKGFGRTRLFPPPGQWRDGLIVICEGESDCLCALSHGINAVTQTAGAGTWRKEFSREFVGRDVVIAYDADLVGLAGAEKAAASLGPAAKLVRIIAWPDFMTDQGVLPEDHGQDLTDFFVTHGRSVADFMDLLGQAKTVQAEADDEGPFRYFRQGATGHWSFKSNLLAREILAEHAIITDGQTGLTYRWEGSYWEEFPEGQIRRLTLNKLGYEATSARAKDAASQVIDLSLLDPSVTMNPDPDRLCIKNGTLDLKSMSVGPHRKEDLITIKHPVSYDPRAPAPCRRWQDFLLETVQIEPIIDELQEFFGYCLTRHTKYERALLLLGPGQDGKSTCLNVLQAMVGDQYVSNVDLSNLDNEFHRAMLYAKLLNVFTEVEAQVFTSAYFKAIVSGDGMNAAFKHKDGFEFRPSCKLAFSSNRFPKVQDNSSAFFRRLLPIRFRWQVPNEERDPDLLAKLTAELDGIFGWAVQGLKRLQGRGGFDLCDMTMDVVNEYKFSNNPIIGFMEECTTEENPFLFGGTASISKADLYGAYRDFCIKYGFNAMNAIHFSRELLTQKPTLKTTRPSIDGGRQWYWEGITLVRKQA